MYSTYIILASALMVIVAAQNQTKDVQLSSPRLEQRRHRLKRLSTPYLTSETVRMAKYVVSLRSRTPKKFFGDNHYCGGAIVSPRFVITAGFCAMNKRKVIHRARTMLIVAGTPNRLKFVKHQSRNVPVKKLFLPINFTIRNRNNIALVLLAEPLTLNSYIGVIGLPTSPPHYGEMHTVLGWGRVYYRGPLASHILSIDVELIPYFKCKKMFFTWTTEMMCAGNMDDDLDENPCTGDKGGPMIYKDMIYGIVSYQIGCSNRKLPSAYTSVWHHMDWINKIMTANDQSRGIHLNIWLELLLAMGLYFPSHFMF